jgi:hypothetical protein
MILIPIMATLNTNQWKPDLGFGVWAYASDYFFGVSVQQILPQSLYVTGSSSLNKTVPHYFFTVGTKLFLSDDVTLIPSVLVKVIKPVPTTFDVNMKMSFQDKFWIRRLIPPQRFFCRPGRFQPQLLYKRRLLVRFYHLGPKHRE